MIRVRTRKEWGAKPPKSPKVYCNWSGKECHLHHTAMHFTYKTRLKKNRIEEEKKHMRLLQQVAWDRGFDDISYNYVVFPSGRVYAGRGPRIVGAHTLGHNLTPGIVLAGNYDVQKVSNRQRTGVNRLVHRLHKTYGVRHKLVPHRYVYATACPGRHAIKAFKLEKYV